MPNQYGLSRDIPADVMRQVRAECYFGCVVCGLFPYEYEHFDPPFADARSHAPSRIALLCSSHHTDRTAGRMSVATVAAARLTPHNADNDAVWPGPIGFSPPMLRFGTNTMTGFDIGVSVNGSVVVGVKAPAPGSRDWLLTGSFVDRDGQAVLRFDDNRVVASRGSWDVTFVGKLLTVRRAKGELTARVRFDAESSEITIERLDMGLSGNNRLIVDAHGLFVSGSFGRQGFSGVTMLADGAQPLFRIGPEIPTGPFQTVAINEPSLGGFADWTKP
jgi:hypothetical protein